MQNALTDLSAHTLPEAAVDLLFFLIDAQRTDADADAHFLL